jgi:CubicO group peptidase (beta-lactamase class C family)
MIRYPLTTALFALCFVFSASLTVAKEPAAALPTASPAEAGLDGAKLDEIARRMEDHVGKNTISGAVTLVVKDGKIVHHAATGQRDTAGKQAMEKDTIFAIASMTKPITGAAVMILVDEGKISLDDPVSKYIPEFKDAKLKSGEALKREITVRDVVTQQNMGTIQETAKKLAARPLEFQPGEKWMYSPGLTVAGAVVEIASGQPFDKFLAERIFTPLGMQDTTFNPTPQQHPRIVKLYKQEGGKLSETTHWINDFSSHREPNPSGGLFSTAADMGAFYAMVLSGGELNGKRILSEKSAQSLTTVHSGETTTGFTPGNGWGVGWCVVCEPQGVTAMLSKGSAGHGGAFGTQGWIDPEKKMAFVLMIQRTGLPNGDASDMRRDLQQLAVEAIKK